MKKKYGKGNFFYEFFHLVLSGSNKFRLNGRSEAEFNI